MKINQLLIADFRFLNCSRESLATQTKHKTASFALLCFFFPVIPSGFARRYPTLVEISEESLMRVLLYDLIPLDWPTMPVKH
jgi:hypothetical protein